MSSRRFKILLAICTSAVLAAGAFFAGRSEVSSGEENNGVLTADLYALDTFCTVTLYEGGSTRILEEFSNRLNRFDALFDCNKENSDLYRINHRSKDRVEIAEETAEMLLAAKELEEETGKSLLISIRPLTELWDVKHRTELPSEEAIRGAREASVNAVWKLEEADGKICFVSEQPETRLEIGAFAKGYIADQLKEFLEENGVTKALIDLGGNVHTLGCSLDGSAFRIGIRDPDDSGKAREIVEVIGESVVTAGFYERYFEVDGKRYHHILDPSTGWPVENDLASVTVIGKSSFVCDGLATAFYVMGREKACSFLDQWNGKQGGKEEENYRALFILKSGEAVWNYDTEQTEN